MERTYETDELIVYWDSSICEHAGMCVRGLPKVFEVGRRPWIMLEKASAEEIMNVIDQCPSHALRYEKKEVSR